MLERLYRSHAHAPSLGRSVACTDASVGRCLRDRHKTVASRVLALVRLLAFFLTLALSLNLMPTLQEGRGRAAAQTLANGITLVGDFRGSGAQQIATLYDPNDDFGLRIVVLDRATDGKFTHSAWFLGKASQFDLS